MSRPLVSVAVVLAAILAAAAIWANRHPEMAPVEPTGGTEFDTAQLLLGEALTGIGACEVCHTAPGGAPFAGEDPPEPAFINTCYSLLSADYGISVAAVYRLDENGEIASIPGSGGTSPAGASSEFRKAEAEVAEGWYASITADLFG